jgi:hypothetical protein
MICWMLRPQLYNFRTRPSQAHVRYLPQPAAVLAVGCKIVGFAKLANCPFYAWLRCVRRVGGQADWLVRTSC